MAGYKTVLLSSLPMSLMGVYFCCSSLQYLYKCVIIFWYWLHKSAHAWNNPQSVTTGTCFVPTEAWTFHVDWFVLKPVVYFAQSLVTVVSLIFHLIQFADSWTCVGKWSNNHVCAHSFAAARSRFWISSLAYLGNLTSASLSWDSRWKHFCLGR